MNKIFVVDAELRGYYCTHLPAAPSRGTRTQAPKRALNLQSPNCSRSLEIGNHLGPVSNAHTPACRPARQQTRTVDPLARETGNQRRTIVLNLCAAVACYRIAGGEGKKNAAAVLMSKKAHYKSNEFKFKSALLKF